MGKISDWVVGGLGAGIAVLVTVLALATPGEALASTPANITNTVGVCDPDFPQQCIAPAADGSLVVSGTVSTGALLASSGLGTTEAVRTGATGLADGSGTLAVQNIPGSNSSQGITPMTNVGGNAVVGKASPGNLFALNAVAPVTLGFVQVYNLTAAPADASTNTPLWCMPLAANAGLDKVFNPPLVATTGITVVYSSSACGAALVKVNAVYLQSMAK